ncbi:MAG: cysteine desulfurase [Bacilli bacterium]|nr:cysteine desulfurase [Bacilli bacterium]
MIDVKKIREDFPMLRSHQKMQGHDLVWLDNASTTFKPDCVIEAINRYYRDETSNSHRGDYDLCYHMDQEVASTRKAVARFINAKEEEIVFTSGATDSINLIAYGYALKKLKKGDEILLSEEEHASNVLPWFRIAELTGAIIRYIPLSQEGRILPEAVEKAMSDRVKIVSLAHVGNVLGYALDAKAIAEIVHRYGAILSLDGAQSVPHKKVDVQKLDIDFLSFSGHKMLGPTGIGVLYGKYSLLEEMDPLTSGGGMNVKFDLDGSKSFLPPPLRFEAGTQNLAGILGLRAAVEYLEKIGLQEIEKYEQELRKYAVEKLSSTGKVTIYNPDAEGGIVTFNIKDVFAQDAATYLNSLGIACRSGNHCAKMLYHHLGSVATVRASFYLYTTKEEIDALVDAVSKGGNYLDAYFN